MKKVFCIIVSFALISCNNNWGNYGSYKLEYTSGLKYFIALNKGEPINGIDSIVDSKKGTRVKFIRASGRVDTITVGKDAEVIGSFVDKNNISFNKKFILVDQKPFELICHNTNYDECKTALQESNLHHYWIIDQENDNIYGPFNKEEFSNKRMALNIPQTLNIKVQ